MSTISMLCSFAQPKLQWSHASLSSWMRDVWLRRRKATTEVGTVKGRTLCSCQSAIGGNTCCVSVPDACHISMRRWKSSITGLICCHSDCLCIELIYKNKKKGSKQLDCITEINETFLACPFVGSVQIKPSFTFRIKLIINYTIVWAHLIISCLMKRGCVISLRWKGHTMDTQNPDVYEIDAAKCLASCQIWRLAEHNVHLSNREQN